ncbi:hypothetical protein, partial [Sinorhizobium fredii]|uniref:hypothetical protein n=1 Tax=Rhizobium fredii TaxID=380 RepID=UPI001AEBDAFD
MPVLDGVMRRSNILVSQVSIRANLPAPEAKLGGETCANVTNVAARMFYRPAATTDGRSGGKPLRTFPDPDLLQAAIRVENRFALFL